MREQRAIAHVPYGGRLIRSVKKNELGTAGAGEACAKEVETITKGGRDGASRKRGSAGGNMARFRSASVASPASAFEEEGTYVM